MAKFWAWLSEPKNLAVLVAVGSVIGFVINKVVPSNPKPAAPAVEQSAVADGGTAVNATGRAQVGVGAAPASMPASAAALAVRQRASASEGGVAVNASDSAQVTIGGPQQGAAASR